MNDKTATAANKSLPKLKVESLDELVIKPKAVITTAKMKSESGIYLLNESSDSMVHNITKLGDEVERLKVGDQVLEFARVIAAYEWKGNVVMISDEYSVELAVRK